MPGGGIQNLVRAVGGRRAKQLLLTARRFSAEQASVWGMVTTLADTGQALAAAVAEAREIALAAPMSVHYAKLAASRGGEVDFHTGYALDIAAYNVLVSSEDRLEGVRAFNEKRAPRWSGRCRKRSAFRGLSPRPPRMQRLFTTAQSPPDTKA